jgi:hypothetical protein
MGILGKRTCELFMALLGILTAGTSSPAADKPKAVKLNFQDHILPILRDKCVACHDPDKMKGGLDVTTYAKLMEGGGSGAVIKPGDAEGSRLYQTVAHKAQPFMPPKSDRLPQQILDTIKMWIDEGALENAGSKAIALKPKTDVSLTSVVRGRPEGPPPMPEPGKLSIEPVVYTARGNAVTAIAANPWSPLVAVAGHRQVILYNADTLSLVGVLPFPYGLPTVLKFSRNGSLLLAGGGRGGHSGKVVVWSVRTGEKIIEVGDETDAVLAADISPDQTQIALGGPSKMIRVYSTRDGEKIRDIKKHTDWIYTIEYSPDGVLFATGDRNGGLFVWETHSGREYFSLRGHTAAITDLSWRWDSNILASASEDTTIRLWEMENGGQVRSWGAHGGGTLSVRYSHDNRIASVGRDRVAKVWDESGNQKAVSEPFPDVALKVAVTHDNKRVVAGDWTGLVRVLLMDDGKKAGEVTNNPPPAAVQFEAAMKEVVAKQLARDQAKAAMDQKAQVLQQAQQNLAAAQKALTDYQAAVATAMKAVQEAKELAQKAKEAVPPVEAQVKAKAMTHTVLNEARAKIKAAADAAPNDAALKTELQMADKLVSQATAELEAVRKQFETVQNNVNAATAKVAEAEKVLADMQAKAAEAPKVVEQRMAELKAAAEAHQAAVNLFQQTTEALLTATRAAVEKFQLLPPKN